jgi:purine-binding chemotaxis protein CheW
MNNLMESSRDDAVALDTSGLWVLVRVGASHCALASNTVLEMVSAPVAHAVPFAPPSVRGLASLRGQIGPVVDMRTRLGLASIKQEQAELVQLLHDRERDHREWLEDLEASVRERRAFTRTLDPHQCAFGKWYDTYQAPTLELAFYLRRFAEPHARIHQEGAVVEDLVRAGRIDDALARIAHDRNTICAHLCELFEGARQLVKASAREIAVIVNTGGRSVGIVVDEVEGVDHLKAGSLDALPAGFGSNDRAICGTARTQRDDKLVVVIDLAAVARGEAAAADLVTTPSRGPSRRETASAPS